MWCHVWWWCICTYNDFSVLLCRYDWRYIQELIMYYIDQVILEYEAQSQVEVGRHTNVLTVLLLDRCSSKHCCHWNLDSFDTPSCLTIAKGGKPCTSQIYYRDLCSWIQNTRLWLAIQLHTFFWQLWRYPLPWHVLSTACIFYQRSQ